VLRVFLAPSHTCKHVLPGNGCSGPDPLSGIALQYLAGQRIGTSRIRRIKRRTRCRPDLWPWRFMCRAIWREPYQGVFRNCLSMIFMNFKFSALSPTG